MLVGDYAIVLAIDSVDEEEVLRLSAAVGPMVDAVKIGVPTIFACGIGIVRKIKERSGGQIVADLKVADIGFRDKSVGESGSRWSGTNSKIVQAAIGAGIDYVICHSIVGTSSIRECVEAAHSSGGKVLTVPFMTNEGAGLFFDAPVDWAHLTFWLEKDNPLTLIMLEELRKRKAQEKGWRTTAITVSDLILTLGEELDVDGYIAPANHPEVMRDYRKLTSKVAFATGVGRQGGRIEDVYTILGRKSAAIVGHAICGAPDPVAACREFLAAKEKAGG